ncbi:efflux RND transporter periplasmic adaptor subunit [Halobacillus naozhouensis]|uniref:Efflux RND transporter periplasmic adaptor subunit n=1 Tax=Halobacillus naozhouensis TaxID=554880 RepID=A0ABY8J107_9BACI|nr:efflux RND transporter periplasmic adaptor subunit [Halobacillus naozhouensis]WFT75244.1 efflux RND transporter periplasmic adaptor subunit [Halobacillus naozhouensis]
MRTRYKVRICGLLIIAFLTLNASLIYFDRDSEVDRKSYINEWSSTFTEDLFESIHTSGIFTSNETNPVYFDKQSGSFQEFLVEEGDEVSEGDELYTYKVVNYEEQLTQLKTKAVRLQEEIISLTNYINELGSFTVPETGGASPPSFIPESSPDDSFSQDLEPQQQEGSESQTIETEFMKQKAIAEKELQLSQKQAHLSMVENQLRQLEETGQSITVTSEFSGVVTNLSENLHPPLLTLSSSNLIVSGELSEEHRKQVEEGMSSYVRIPDLEVEVTGLVESIKPFPKNVDVQQPSHYPYKIVIEENKEQVRPGYHANVEIITAEATDAVAAYDDVLKNLGNSSAWVMGDRGRLEKREIETGIREDRIVEVTEGLEEGEYLADQPEDEFREGSVFLTPLKLEHFEVQSLFEIDPSLMLDYGLLGLMNR